MLALSFFPDTRALVEEKKEEERQPLLAQNPIHSLMEENQDDRVAQTAAEAEMENAPVRSLSYISH